MDFLVKGAESFIGLFQLGANTFMSWMTGIVPIVLMLMVFMNVVIKLIGEGKNQQARTALLEIFLGQKLYPTFLASLLHVGEPRIIHPREILPEFYKPSFYAALAQYNHTSNGLFPHINAGELFVFLGIASGVETLGLSTTPLAIRYLLVGLVMNAVGAYVIASQRLMSAKKPNYESVGLPQWIEPDAPQARSGPL